MSILCKNLSPLSSMGQRAIGRTLNTYIKENKFDEFVAKYISLDYNKGGYRSGNMPVSLVKQEGVAEAVNITEARDVYNAIENILTNLFKFDDKTVKEYTAKLRTALNIVNSGNETTVEVDNTTRTYQEFIENENNSLQNVLTYIYGYSGIRAASTFQQDFKENLMKTCVADISKGILRDLDTESLNENIIEFKNKQFQNLVSYLQNQFPRETITLKKDLYNKIASKNNNKVTVDLVNYNTAIALFKNKVLGRQGFFKDIETATLNSSNQNYRIKSKDPLLQAVDAFTSLEYFDSLLTTSFGNLISFKPGTKNHLTIFKDKYKFGHDSSHERKSWQNSENYSAEKATTLFTQTLLSCLPVYDLQTEKDTGRNLNPTHLINAISNFKDYITFRGGTLIQDVGTLTPEQKQFNHAYSNIHENPLLYTQQLFQALFAPNAKGNTLISTFAKTETFSSLDVNVLYSVYRILFDKNNPNSFINHSEQHISEYSAFNVIEEICRYMDNNVSVNYLTTEIDYSTGTISSVTKAKYHTNINALRYVQSVNHYITTLDDNQRQTLAQKYPFNLQADGECTVKISNNLTLNFKSSLSTGVYYDTLKPQDANLKFTFLDGEGKDITDFIFDNIMPNKINLASLGQKILDKNALTPLEQSLKDLFQYFDDITDSKFLIDPIFNLGTLELAKNNFEFYRGHHNIPLYKGSSWLDPFLTLALRCSTINDSYIKATSQNLNIKDFLTENSYVPFYQNLRSLSSNKNYLITKRFKQFLNPCYSQEPVAKIWANAQSFYTGEASIATTKDHEGNNIPNNSMAKLGCELSYYLQKQRTPEIVNDQETGKQISVLPNTSSLLFVSNPEMIKRTYHDLDVTSTNFTTKKVTDLTPSELGFHSIFNKFWNQYFSTGKESIIIQPTTYSDKTTILNWMINTKFRHNNSSINLMTATQEQLCTLYNDTIGATYSSIYNETINKLDAITKTWAKEKNIKDYEKMSCNDIMHLMTEADLTATASKMRYRKIVRNEEVHIEYYIPSDSEHDNGNVVEVQLDKDYRILGDKTLGINELLQEYADLYTTKYRQNKEMITAIAEQWATDKKEFEDASVETILSSMTEKDLLDTAKRMRYSSTLQSYILLEPGETVKDTLDTKLEIGTDYTITNGHIAITQNKLINKLNIQKRHFIKDLMTNNVSFQVISNGDYFDAFTKNTLPTEYNSKNPVMNTILQYFSDSKRLAQERIDFFNNWVDKDNGRLILAKQGNKNIVNTEDSVDLNTEIELNPFLDTYFNVESFTTFNLRMSLTGSEIGHPVKKGSMFDRVVKAVEDKQDLSTVGITTLSSDESVIFKDIINSSKSIVDLKKVIKEGHISSAIRDSLQNIVDQTLMFNENTSQGTQLKRNQIIPATLQHNLMNSLQAPPSQVKVAVFRDDQAPVFNYRGDHKKDIDACDGGGAVDPLQRVLENRALGPNAVGKVTKPIWHGYDTSAGCATQVKFAAYTITNELMRKSLNSDCSMYNIHKKGKNLQWKSQDNINLGFGYFTRHSDSVLTAFKAIGDPEGKLFYKNKFGQVIQIKDLDIVGIVNNKNIYATLEYNDETKTLKTVYHLFYDTDDDSSIHIATTDKNEIKGIFDNPNYKNVHSINSLYELYTAFGDAYCCDSEGNYNEYNHEVIANYVCNIGSIKPDTNDQVLTQENVNQPLKDYYIGYYLNKTTMKSGVKNINPSDAWKNNNPLQYFKLSMAGWGIQMNADAEIVEAKLTEFSQVIAACAAYGYTNENCNKLYEALAQSAIYSSKSLTEATSLLVQELKPEVREQVKSDLYSALGQILFASSMVKDEKSLSGIIIQGVKEVFYKNSIHYYDDSKIPFSETTVYSNFITQLTSTITKQSIKRKHPGHGCVMVPAYNIMQYYEITNDMGIKQRLNTDEVLNKALADYRNELITYLQDNNVEYALLEGVASLEAKALKIDDTGMFSSYYSRSKDNTACKKHFINTYLHKIQQQQEAKPREYFMPTDVVEVLDKDGHYVATEDLSNMNSYYAFKNKVYPEGTIFRTCVTKARNLRPSLIRWQYVDDDGNQRYMNYFDLPHVKEAYENGIKKENQAAYRKQVQQALHNLHDGFFYIGEKRYDIIPDSLENTKAEIVMGNMYKQKFGIETNSINEILETGQDYFRRIKAAKIEPPTTDIYDLAYVDESGKHTLIKVGPINTSEACVIENPFVNLHTLNDGRIMISSSEHNDLFQIGKWEETNNILWNEDLQSFVSTDGSPVENQEYYRINNKTKKIEKRIDFVKRYTYSSLNKGECHESTLYQINREAINSPKLLGEICRNIYKCGQYAFPQKNLMIKDDTTFIDNILRSISVISEIPQETLDIINVQLSNTSDIENELKEAKNNYINETAKKTYTSFLDSIKVIAARIPAQTMQSYMAMEIVGWGETGDNYCYVSHFQTFLQGSDYDIDKAYIMGQNYGYNGVYLGWSPFFSYDSLSSLEASKELPIPKGNTITLATEGANVKGDILNIALGSRIEEGVFIDERGNITKKPIYKSDDPNFIKNLGKILTKVQKANGKIDTTTIDENNISKYAGKNSINIFINTLQYHESYQISDKVISDTYKNVASANIFNISHDIRNRDQAYTEIAMNDVRASSENTPKGEQVLEMNLLNPMTKLIMQYQNLVGKDVISVAANGEKYWFNTYYYWTQKLLNGTPEEKEYLKFQIELWGVKGRAKGTKFDPENATSTFNHLPDLDITHNENLRRGLFELLGIDESSVTKEQLEELEGYKYVDQMISQLLSAATDNAKELILAKINAGTNFAKMFLFLMTAGEDINDIAAFMTSPTAEFIVGKAEQNIFQQYYGTLSPGQAINLAQGFVKAETFLHGVIEGASNSKLKDVKQNLIGIINTYPSWKESVIASIIKFNDSALHSSKEGEDPLQKLSLNQIMQGIIFSTITTSDFKKEHTYDFKWENLPFYKYDYEVQQYYTFCKDLCVQLKKVINQYNELYPNRGLDKNFELMCDDAKSFKDVFGYATEMSQITTSLLSLNQGLPSDYTDIIAKLAAIKKVVTQQEQRFFIKDNSTAIYTFLMGGDDPQGEGVWRRIMDHKTSMIDSSKASEYFKEAYNKGIVGNFDPVKMICDEEYRETAKNYLEIIKGQINAIDLVYSLPQYKAIMECFKAVLVSQQEVSVKHRTLLGLLSKIETTDEESIKKLSSYIDDLISNNFIKDLPPIDIASAGIESTNTFDEYWNSSTTSMFDLHYFNDLGGFKLFMETTFTNWLKTNFKNNPLVKHLKLLTTVKDIKAVLATDIDLISPDYTEYNKYSFDECIRGMMEFEKVPFGKTNYTVADLFQLYNILVHKNKNNRTSLTPLFRACTNPNSILQQYYKYIADLDYSDSTLDYYVDDARIAMAPTVSKAAEFRSKTPFIRVRDNSKGEVLKYKSSYSNTYEVYNLLPALDGVIEDDDEDTKFQRFSNFQEYCPFDMPKYNEKATYGMAIKLADLKSHQSLKTLKNAIINLISSNRLNITINC